MMLSAGESILWLAKQMGHKNTKMIIEVYAKWLPQPNTEAGYKPVNDWSVVVKVA
jgi:integrase